MADTKRDIAISLGLFAATVGLALAQHWSPTDLVWSLWISSLFVGYSLILTSILGFLLHGSPSAILGRAQTPQAAPPTPSGGTDLPPAVPTSTSLQMIPLNLFVLIGGVFVFGWRRAPLWLGVVLLASTVFAAAGMLRKRRGWEFLPDPERGLAKAVLMLPMALFLLGFFTIHFLGFHLVHGLFLNAFFPIADMGSFGKDFDTSLAFVAGLTSTALRRYWPFVASSVLSRLPTYAKAFARNDGSMMVVPYVNVIRMHVTILVFALMAAAGLKSGFLYPLLVVYFLPVGSILGWWSKRAAIPIDEA